MLTIGSIMGTTICYAHTVPFVVPFVFPQRGTRLMIIIIMLAISLIIGTTICYAHSVPFCCSLCGSLCCSVKGNTSYDYHYYAGNQLNNRNNNLLCTYHSLLLFLLLFVLMLCYVDDHGICMLIGIVF